MLVYMIDSKLSLVPAKKPQNFAARPYKITNSKKIQSLKMLKHFYKIAPLSSHVLQTRRKCKQSTFCWL